MPTRRPVPLGRAVRVGPCRQTPPDAQQANVQPVPSPPEPKVAAHLPWPSRAPERIAASMESMEPSEPAPTRRAPSEPPMPTCRPLPLGLAVRVGLHRQTPPAVQIANVQPAEPPPEPRDVAHLRWPSREEERIAASMESMEPSEPAPTRRAPSEPPMPTCRPLPLGLAVRVGLHRQTPPAVQVANVQPAEPPPEPRDAAHLRWPSREEERIAPAGTTSCEQQGRAQAAAMRHFWRTNLPAASVVPCAIHRPQSSTPSCASGRIALD